MVFEGGRSLGGGEEGCISTSTFPTDDDLWRPAREEVVDISVSEIEKVGGIEK